MFRKHVNLSRLFLLTTRVDVPILHEALFQFFALFFCSGQSVCKYLFFFMGKKNHKRILIFILNKTNQDCRISQNGAALLLSQKAKGGGGGNGP